MTEQQIEIAAERKMDALDRRFMGGELTRHDYDAAVRQLDRDTRTQVYASRRAA